METLTKTIDETIDEKVIDIKETMEMIKASKVINGFVASVLEDHELTPADFQHVVALSANYQCLKDGYEGKEKIIGEIKDLTKDELITVILAMYDSFEVFAKAKTLSKFR